MRKIHSHKQQIKGYRFKYTLLSMNIYAKQTEKAKKLNLKQFTWTQILYTIKNKYSSLKYEGIKSNQNEKTSFRRHMMEST